MKKHSVLLKQMETTPPSQPPNIRRAIYPQEFMLAATYLNDFEFVVGGITRDLSLPLDEVTRGIVRPITILRRR